MRLTKLLSILCLGGTMLLVSACSGDDNAPVTPKSVYILGSESGTDFFPRVVKVWKDGVPTTLSNPSTDAAAWDFHIENTDVYVAGYQEDGSFNRQATVWKNGVATTLTTSNGDKSAYDVTVSGSTVYVCGDQTTATTSEATLWTNNVPSVLPFSTTFSRAAISIVVEGSDVYVGGVDVKGGSQAQALVWKNGTATAITGGTTAVQYIKLVRSGNETLSLLILTNNEGFRQGFLHKLGDDGSTGSYGLAQTTNVETAVLDLFVAENGDKYIVGTEYISNTYKPILWKNGTRVDYFPESNNDITPNSVFIDGTDIYVAGQEQNDAGEDKLAAWKNGVRLDVTLSENSIASRARKIIVK